VRAKFDGNDPTATNGMYMDTEGNGAEYILNGESDVTNAKFIRQSGTDATLNVSYFAEIYRRDEP
jgi:hypothetical protein